MRSTVIITKWDPLLQGKHDKTDDTGGVQVDKETPCAICLEPFEAYDEVCHSSLKRSCDHSFHWSCMEDWLTVCRKQIRRFFVTIDYHRRADEPVSESAPLPRVRTL